MDKSPVRSPFSGDINGLVVVIGVLIALMLLPGPSEAEFHAGDILMNDVVRVQDLTK